MRDCCCGAEGPNVVVSLTPVQLTGGAGGRNRAAPRVLAPYEIPRNTSIPDSTAPDTLPDDVSTTVFTVRLPSNSDPLRLTRAARLRSLTLHCHIVGSARSIVRGSVPVDSSRYVLISSDCHAGADLRDYKPYLEQRWHDDFEAWAATYFDSWANIDAESEWKAGVSSFMDPLNWDSNKRLEALETEGIVAEVIFPNTVPPFFPNGLLAAPGPRTADEYEQRWAGIKAHNRWLKDFCDEAPGRRFGVAQIFIDNVDDAVQEIRWAKEAGLRQVLLPSDHHLKLHNLYYASLEPIWSVCEELDMPIGRHGSVVGSDVEPTPSTRLMPSA